MREYLEIGCTPLEEDCFPAGHPLARAECYIYKRQLERLFPLVKIGVRSNPHDFGTYYECVAYYDDESQEELNQALTVEGDSPTNWDAIAKQELEALNASPMVN